MTIHCIWEHNGDDSLLYAVEPVGAYARGESLDVALKKLPGEVAACYRWRGQTVPDALKIELAGEKVSPPSPSGMRILMYCCQAKRPR